MGDGSVSETLEQRLIRHEGLRLMPYRDAGGRLTIGVGRCLDAKGISRAEAMLLLSHDIADAEQQVTQALPWAAQLNALRRDVLHEMAFQLGIGGLLAFRRMLAALQQHDYAAARREMLGSSWHAQAPQRCEELAQLISPT